MSAWLLLVATCSTLPLPAGRSPAHPPTARVPSPAPPLCPPPGQVRSRIPLLPPGVLPCGCFEEEKLCADLAEPIKVGISCHQSPLVTISHHYSQDYSPLPLI